MVTAAEPDQIRHSLMLSSYVNDRVGIKERLNDLDLFKIISRSFGDNTAVLLGGRLWIDKGKGSDSLV